MSATPEDPEDQEERETSWWVIALRIAAWIALCALYGYLARMKP